MVQSISLDYIKTALGNLSQTLGNLTKGLTDQYFKKKLQMNFKKNDITGKMYFLPKNNILSNKSTSKGYYFYFTENVD